MCLEESRWAKRVWSCDVAVFAFTLPPRCVISFVSCLLFVHVFAYFPH
jgi:hypothetical protein